MANEIRVSSGLTVTKANLAKTISTRQVFADLAGTRYSAGAQDIGTTYEALTYGADMGSSGWCVFVNLDATNYVEIGVEVSAAFYPVVKLLPGEQAVFRASILTLFARANTAAVKLDKFVLEA